MATITQDMRFRLSLIKYAGNFHQEFFCNNPQNYHKHVVHIQYIPCFLTFLTPRLDIII